MKNLTLFLSVMLLSFACAENKKADTLLKQSFDGNNYSFNYPEDWKQSAAGFAVNLMPASTPKDNFGFPLYTASITVTPAGAVKSVKDPALAPWFDRLVGTTGKFKRIAATEFKSFLGEAIAFQYKGKSFAGVETTVDFYYTLTKDGRALTFMNAGRSDLYMKNVEKAVRIYTSIKLKVKIGKALAAQKKTIQTGSAQTRQSSNQVSQVGTLDRRLVGKWLNTEYHNSGSLTGDYSFSSESHALLQINANGTCSWVQGGQVLGSTGAGATVIGGNNKQTWTGRWSTANSVVSTKWSDKSVTHYRYTPFQHNGRTSLLFIVNGKKRYFHPVNRYNQ